MGGFSFLDHLFNVCRTLWDVLHILAYLFLVLIAIIVAIYKYDRRMYDRYVYFPIFKLFYKKEYDAWVRLPGRGRRQRIEVTVWSPVSNRIPYILKTIKNFINKFNK